MPPRAQDHEQANSRQAFGYCYLRSGWHRKPLRWTSRAKALPIAHWPVLALSAGITVQSPRARASRLTSRHRVREKGSTQPDNMNCVEWVLFVLERAGVPVPDDVLTPRDLLRWYAASFGRPRTEISGRSPGPVRQSAWADQFRWLAVPDLDSPNMCQARATRIAKKTEK